MVKNLRKKKEKAPHNAERRGKVAFVRNRNSRSDCNKKVALTKEKIEP
jgi:hypothetical protein